MPESENALPSVLSRLQRYVSHETPSGDVARASALAGVLAAELRDLGAAVTEHEAPGWGTHVEARVEGAESGLAPLFLLGHLDTVFPVGTLAQRPFRVAEGRATGPGVYDMKGGLAVLVEALAELRGAGARPRRPLRILVSCDEEVGSSTSRPLIDALAHGAAAALVLEPSLPGGGAKTARKGVANYTLRALGRAAHVGADPKEGISAVTELAHQILAAQALAAPERGTTVIAGLIGGGTASNVVPAEAWAEVDVRFATGDEAARIDTAMRALAPVVPGARLEITGGVNRPPLERTDAGVALYRAARAVAAEIGVDLPEGSTGGASDGNFTAALGVPTLDGLGPQGGGAHAVHEHVLVEDLPRRVALLRRLLETL